MHTSSGHWPKFGSCIKTWWSRHPQHTQMPMVSEMRHPRGLDFETEREVVKMRDKGMSWDDIAESVTNIADEPSTADTVKRAYHRFNTKHGRSHYKFANCGRKSWKLTPAIQRWLINKLLQLRMKTVCTSTALQTLLARDKGIKVAASAIRKVLLKHGYKWKPRCQKRRYDDDDKAKRVKFCKAVVRMSDQQLREKFALSLDGVVITIPPTDPVDRHNYCWSGVTHMWRKDSEADTPALAGADGYECQVPQNRTLPMWGGIGRGGCAVVAIHDRRKLTATDWTKIVESGKLNEALRRVKPAGGRPWRVLCDGEKFLHVACSKKAMRSRGITLWRNPPRSPDLNPVERFWAWLRSELRRRDLEDLRAKRRPLGRTAYRQRLRAVMNSPKAQLKAKNIYASFKKVCKIVIKRKGAHSGK